MTIHSMILFYRTLNNQSLNNKSAVVLSSRSIPDALIYDRQRTLHSVHIDEQPTTFHLLA